MIFEDELIQELVTLKVAAKQCQASIKGMRPAKDSHKPSAAPIVQRSPEPLARSCETDTTDSCDERTRLGSPRSDNKCPGSRACHPNAAKLTPSPARSSNRLLWSTASPVENEGCREISRWLSFTHFLPKWPAPLLRAWFRTHRCRRQCWWSFCPIQANTEWLPEWLPAGFSRMMRSLQIGRPGRSENLRQFAPQDPK